MIEVIKQLVETIEWCHGGEPVGTAEAIQAGKKLIAELESQEPSEDLATELFVVAQVSPADNGFSETIERIESWLREHFTHQPQHKPLTDEEIIQIVNANSSKGLYLMAKAIEAKLKERNGYSI